MAILCITPSKYIHLYFIKLFLGTTSKSEYHYLHYSAIQSLSLIQIGDSDSSKFPSSTTTNRRNLVVNIRGKYFSTHCDNVEYDMKQKLPTRSYRIYIGTDLQVTCSKTCSPNHLCQVIHKRCEITYTPTEVFARFV